MNRATGEYEEVIAPAGGVVVNIGGALQFWTSDVLLANVCILLGCCSLCIVILVDMVIAHAQKKTNKTWFPLNVSVIATNRSCLLARMLLRFYRSP